MGGFTLIFDFRKHGKILAKVKNPLGVTALNSILAKYQLEVGELGDFSLTSSYETIGYYCIFEFPMKFPVPIANLIFILSW